MTLGTLSNDAGQNLFRMGRAKPNPEFTEMPNAVDVVPRSAAFLKRACSDVAQVKPAAIAVRK
jgi:hypothetical protein